MSSVPERQCGCDPTFPTLAPCLPTWCAVYHWAQLVVHAFLFVVVLLQVRTIHREMKKNAKAGKAGASNVRLYEVMHFLFIAASFFRWSRALAVILDLDLPTTFFDFSYAAGFTGFLVTYTTLGLLWYLTWLELDRVMGDVVKPIEELERRRKKFIRAQVISGSFIVLQGITGYTMYSLDHSNAFWYLYVSRLSPGIVALYGLAVVIPTMLQARRIRKVVTEYQADHPTGGFNYAKLTAAIYIGMAAAILGIVTGIVSSLVLRTGTDQDFLLRNVTFRVAESLIGFLILSYFARPPQSLRNLKRKNSGSRLRDMSKSLLKRTSSSALVPRKDSVTVLKLEPDVAAPADVDNGTGVKVPDDGDDAAGTKAAPAAVGDAANVEAPAAAADDVAGGKAADSAVGDGSNHRRRSRSSGSNGSGKKRRSSSNGSNGSGKNRRSSSTGDAAAAEQQVMMDPARVPPPDDIPFTEAAEV